MKGFVKWMDEAPFWLKIVFALPVLDLVRAVYRIIKEFSLCKYNIRLRALGQPTTSNSTF